MLRWIALAVICLIGGAAMAASGLPTWVSYLAEIAVVAIVVAAAVPRQIRRKRAGRIDG